MPAPTLKNALARVLLRLGLFENLPAGLSALGPADAASYDVGVYGNFPELVFNTSELVAPRVLMKTWEPSCEADDSQHYFFAPYGYEDYHPGPMILDTAGNLVWADQSLGQTYGLDVQYYKGEPYLTWWSGDDRTRGHGVGTYYMVDSSYTNYKKIGAFNNLPADLHEFRITRENTGMITSFVNTKYDLRPYGGYEEGYVWDGVFQEFDIETNKLIFEWRASDHYTPADCVDAEDSTGTMEDPWDFFHINSIDKDNQGNYLISSRYCYLSYISGKTGKVLWQLGGEHSSFEDLSGGNATDFEFQHHARWTDDYRAITLFDNQAKSNYSRRIPSRGLKIAVDTKEMTVGVLNEFLHPEGRIGFSQGSMQSLSNGNFLIGWGHTAAITEYLPDGQIVCDLQFAPLQLGEDFSFSGGIGQSYRAFKHKWVGKPHYDPDIHFDRESSLYVSWNGATEVRKWQLEGSVDRDSWQLIHQVRKTGFETKINVDVRPYHVFRLTAMDKKDRTLGQWNVFTSDSIHKVYDNEILVVERGLGPFLLFIGFFVVLSITCALLSGIAVYCVRRRRRGRHMLLRYSHFAVKTTDEDDPESASLTKSFDSSSDSESDGEKEDIETTKGSFI